MDETGSVIIFKDYQLFLKAAKELLKLPDIL